MSILVLLIILAFWPFTWQRQPFWKNQPITAQLSMPYDIPTRFHKVWSKHLREIERTKMCGRIIIIIKITRYDMIWRIISNSKFQKNYDGYKFTRTKSTWKPNVPKSGGFLYFGGHFGFKMAAIANLNGRHMVQYVLLPVNIHFL